MRTVTLILVLLAPPGRVNYYSCFVHDHIEILCRDPVTEGLFRPERRFDRFVIAVPAL